MSINNSWLSRGYFITKLIPPFVTGTLMLTNCSVFELKIDLTRCVLIWLSENWSLQYKNYKNYSFDAVTSEIVMNRITKKLDRTTAVGCRIRYWWTSTNTSLKTMYLNWPLQMENQVKHKPSLLISNNGTVWIIIPQKDTDLYKDRCIACNIKTDYNHQTHLRRSF
jgi:hypothetical protein